MPRNTSTKTSAVAASRAATPQTRDAASKKPSGSHPPLVSLTTDFGVADPYAGLLKAVILGICPTAHVVDLCHGIAPYAIPEAGFVLSQSWRYFPKGSVHVVVVDPGVGSSRRALVLDALGHRFVGPDNGVFSMVFREAARAAKPGARGYTVRVIQNPRWMLPSPSQTFHGRDIFAPVAAYLASGKKTSSIGPEIDDALRQDWDLPIRTGKRFWNGAIFKIDHFGNLITNFRVADFPLTPEAFELQAGVEIISRIYTSYAEATAGEYFLIAGSAGYWEISRNQGSAAKGLGLVSGSPLELTLLR